MHWGAFNVSIITRSVFDKLACLQLPLPLPLCVSTLPVISQKNTQTSQQIKNEQVLCRFLCSIPPRMRLLNYRRKKVPHLNVYRNTSIRFFSFILYLYSGSWLKEMIAFSVSSFVPFVYPYRVVNKIRSVYLLVFSVCERWCLLLAQ